MPESWDSRDLLLLISPLRCQLAGVLFQDAQLPCGNLPRATCSFRTWVLTIYDYLSSGAWGLLVKLKKNPNSLYDVTCQLTKNEPIMCLPVIVEN